VRERGRARVWVLQRRLAPYVFVSPFIILFCTFMLYPLLQSVRYAFLATNGPGSVMFVRFGNFRFLLQDPNFWTALKNTAIFAFFSVFLQLPMSLALALLLSSRWLKGRNFFRLAFFSPHLVGQVFVAVLFSLIFTPRFGLLNRVLHSFLPRFLGFDLDTKWLTNQALVMPALVMTALWMYVGFNMIYFLAALQAVDRDLYEAAQVDGANRWQRFLHVTIPGIKPVAVFVVLMSTIGSFQLFELPFVLLKGAGPSNSGLTIVMYLYQTGFMTGDLGYASAIGWAQVRRARLPGDGEGGRERRDGAERAGRIARLAAPGEGGDRRAAARFVRSAPAGNEKMQEIAGAIKAGAVAYLNRQLKSMGIAGIILFLIIGFAPALGWKTAIGFLIGAAASFIAGYVGLLFHSFGANTFIIVRIMEPFWLLAGIIVVLPKLESPAAAAPEIKPAV